ncbi:MAG: PAS domain S-box protein [Anaerolineae bacterium]
MHPGESKNRWPVEEQLHLLESAVNQTSEGIAVLDRDGRILFINRAFAHLHGYTPEELRGEHYSIFHSPEQRAAAEAAVQQLWGTGEFRGEVWHVRRDGARFPALMRNSVLRDPEGRVIGAIATLRDITEEKATEAALQQRNRELALLNQVGRAFSSTLDLDQVLIMVLDGVRTLLRVVACSVWLVDPVTNELVCRQVTGPRSEIVRGWRLQPGQGVIGWVVEHNQSVIVPDSHADPRYFDGVDRRSGIKIRSILAVPLESSQQVIGALQVVDKEVGRFVHTDLTLLESLAATASAAVEHARLYKQARQDAETKTMLLQEVNHRVKNNLSAIIGLLYAERRQAAIEKQEWRQASISNLIGRIQGLATVHDLLSASQWTPVPLHRLASQVIHASLQALRPDRKVDVNVPPSPVEVTPEQASGLALVINELTTNSVKYALGGRQRACVSVRISAKDGEVLFEFQDDGPGYPEEVTRLERHSVGLYLVQKIVTDDLRGELTLLNDDGAVTRIQFRSAT